MAYVFELTFDPATEATIRAIWQRVADAGLPSSIDAAGYRPHISLAVYDVGQFDADACYRKAAAYARKTAPIPIQLSHLGVFVSWENVVFLGVTPTAELLARHQAVLDLCRSQDDALRTYYAPGLWTPHVTLSFNLTPEQAQGILSTVWDEELPIRGMMRALHLVEVTSAYARDIFTCEFESQ